MSARVSGTVVRVLTDENQLVKAGDLLVELDPKDYEVALQRARADLADAMANWWRAPALVGIPLRARRRSGRTHAASMPRGWRS